MDNISAKEQVGIMLLSPGDRAHSVAVLYIVYRTIESNDNITLNKLKKLLAQDLMIKEGAVEGAVATLSSKSLFDSVNRWVKPASQGTTYEIVHLRAHKEIGDEFKSWLAATQEEFPALTSFVPSILTQVPRKTS